MKAVLILELYLTIVLLLEQASGKIFVSKNSMCYNDCLGTLSNPFNNLWAALQNFSSTTQEIILLKNETDPHFLQSTLINSYGQIFTYNENISISGDITIRPLFCYETDAIGLTDSCYEENQKAVIYLKNETTQLIVQGNLTLKNIQIDGIENIGYFNSVPLDSSTCFYKQERCCDGFSANSVTSPSLRCTPYDNIALNLGQNNAFFLLSPFGTSSSLQIESSVFANLNFQHFTNLILVENSGSIALKSVVIENSYFLMGTVQTLDESCASVSQLFFQNISFTNYNKFAFIDNTNTEKGIFFNIGDCSEKTLIASNLTASNLVLMNNTSLGVFNKTKNSFITEFNIQNASIFSTSGLKIRDTSAVTITSLIWSSSSVSSSSRTASIIQVSNAGSVSFSNLYFTQNYIEAENYQVNLVEYLDPSALNLTNFTCSFNNFAKGSQIIYFPDSLINVISNIEISNNVIYTSTNNLLSTNGDLAISLLTFKNNTLQGNSHLIQAPSLTRLKLLDSLISNNSFVGESSVTEPSLIYTSSPGATFEFEGLEISNNNIYENFRIFTFRDSSLIKFNRSSIVDNFLTGSSNKAYLMYLGKYTRLEIKNCNISSNILINYAIFLYQDAHSNINISQTILQGNKIFARAEITKFFEIEQYNTFNLSSIKFYQNYLYGISTSITGYFLYSSHGDNHFIFDSCTFERNGMFEYSYGFYMISSSIYFYDTTIFNNTFGATINNNYFFYATSSNMTFDRYNLSYNYLENATYLMAVVSRSIISFSNGIIENNTLNGIYNKIPVFISATSYSVFYMTNSSIKKNYDVQRGEFLSVKTNTYIYMNNTIIIGNHLSSPSGSVKFLNFGSPLDFNGLNLTFKDNIITSGGGVVYLMRIEVLSKPIVLQADCINNSISNDLAYLFYFNEIELTVTSSTFTGNQAYDQGIIMYIASSIITFTGTAFLKNVFSSSVGGTSLAGSPVDSKQIFINTIISENYFYGSTFFTRADLEDNTISATNLVIEGNVLYGNSIFMLISLGCSFNLTNATISKNYLHNQTYLISESSSSTITIENATIHQNNLFGTSYLIGVSDTSNFYGTSLTFLNNNRIPSSASQNSVNLYLLYISGSKFSLDGLTSENSPPLLVIFTSTGSASNFNITNVTMIQNTRQLMNLFQSTVTFDNLSVYSEASIEGISDSWISATSSSLTMNNAYFANLQGTYGFLGNFVISKLILTNAVLINVHYKENHLLNIFQIDSLYLENITLDNAGPLFSTSLVNNVTMINTYLFSKKVTGNGISISDADNVYFHNVTFYSNQTPKRHISSVIALSEISNTIIISDCNFYNFRTVLGVLYISLQKTVSTVHVTNTLFKNNTGMGSLAGAISIYQSGPSKYYISNCIFLDNQAVEELNAGGRGGAMYLSTSQTSNAPLYMIQNSNFTGNYADLNGGAIYVRGFPPNLTACSFSRNHIKHGDNNIASQAVKLELVYPSSSSRLLQSNASGASLAYYSNYSIMNIGSGVSLPFSFQVILKDLYDQLVIDDSYSTLSFVTSGKLLTSLNSVEAAEGVYQVDDLAITYTPGNSTNLPMQTDGILSFKSLSSTLASFSTNITLSLSFRNCLYGEVLQSDGSCSSCTAGYATFDFSLNSKKSCQKCDPDSMLCSGGALVGPQDGYWRYDIYADIFPACPIPAACIGYNISSTEPGAGSCVWPYVGNLCNDCAPKYTMDNKECKLCSESKLTYILLTIGILFNLFILRSTIFGSIREAEEYLEEIKADKAVSEDDDPGPAIKTLINYLQISSLIGNLDIDWPDYVKTGSAIGDKIAISSPKLLSMRCLYPINGMEHTYIDLLVTTFTPLIFFSVAFVFWIFYFKAKKKNIISEEFRDNIIVSLIIICFNFQSPVLQANLQMFQCVNLFRKDTPKLFLSSDYDIECWTGGHDRWATNFSLPMGILWGIILPVSLFLRIRKNRENLRDRLVILRYSFIFKGYKTDKYYWEFVIMMRKYLLIIITIFGGYRTVGFQIFCAIYINIISFMSEMKGKPFIEHDFNVIQVTSLVSLVLLCMQALLYFYVDDVLGIQLLFLSMWFIATCIFFYFWLRKFLRGNLIKLKKKIQSNERLRRKIMQSKKLSKIFGLAHQKQEDLDQSTPTKQLSSANDNVIDGLVFDEIRIQFDKIEAMSTPNVKAEPKFLATWNDEEIDQEKESPYAKEYKNMESESSIAKECKSFDEGNSQDNLIIKRMSDLSYIEPRYPVSEFTNIFNTETYLTRLEQILPSEEVSKVDINNLTNTLSNALIILNHTMNFNKQPAQDGEIEEDIEDGV